MSLAVRAVSELIGTAMLVAAVVGSGIMAESLTSDSGLALLLNQVSTVLGLGVLIAVLLPVSGAHLNPVVTLGSLLRGDMTGKEMLSYVAAQASGALGGVGLAHLMFGRYALEVSSDERLTPGTFVGEVVATAGLVSVIVVAVHRGQTALLPLIVPAWIGAAYIFTSSTSFANPAVTLGRMFTESFSGIAPLSGLGFMAAQLVGMALALLVVTPIVSPSKGKNYDR